jgi:hypothetical protein
MVYIISQEYKDSFGKNTHKIINIAGVVDLRIIENTNEETDATDFIICYDVGGIDQFICSCTDYSEALGVVKTIINAHYTKQQFDFVDIGDLRPKRVTEDVSIDEVHDLILDIMEQMGYGKLIDLYMKKIEEEEQLLNNDNKEIVNNGESIESVQSQPSEAGGRVGELTTRAAPYSKTDSETVRVSYM